MQPDFILNFYLAMYPSASEDRAPQAKSWAGDDSPCASLGARAHQARRRAGGAEPVAGYRPRGARGLALWQHGPNFVRTMIPLKASQPTVDVVGRRSEDSSHTRYEESVMQPVPTSRAPCTSCRYDHRGSGSPLGEVAGGRSSRARPF